VAPVSVAAELPPAPLAATLTNTAEAPLEPSPLQTVPAARYLRARRALRFRPLRARPVVGVVEVHGAIVSRPSLGLARAAAEPRVVAMLRAARRNRSIRGVILHVDSPGGSALASDRIHHEVVRLARVKPVVAYLSNVAASGGYYVASAAHLIVAQPQSVTGSIGVVAARFAVGPLLERLGVATDVVKRGKRADLFSSARRLDAGERAVYERELDAVYGNFLRVVAEGRGRAVADIEPLAQGRVYSGTDAHARGLVDCLGGLERALHEVRELVGRGGRRLEPRVLRGPRQPVTMAPAFVAPFAASVDALGLGCYLELIELAAGLGDERVLAYWAGD
jgi:protease-4